MRLLGFVKNRSTKEVLSKKVQRFQHKIRLATALYLRDVSDVMLMRLQILHKQMQLQYRIDSDLKFSKWIKKLNILDHKRATRVFYAEIRSKNITADHFGPVKNKSGTFSTTLHESLENWAAYYSELYKYRSDNLNYDSEIYRYPTLTDTQIGNLNVDICVAEIIHAINSLKDYSTPGEDNLLGRGFTILLHLEPGQKSDDNVEGWTIINFISKVISDFWQKGRIPQELKETILRPILKSGDKDPTNPISITGQLLF